ncbi:MAG: hypothetical protein ACRELF_02700 [Gemmataceae bacterium]
MRRSLDEFVIGGIHTTIPIHREILRLPAFRDGHIDTWPTAFARTALTAAEEARIAALVKKTVS